MKNQEAKISGLGPEMPGREVLALDWENGTGAASVYVSIPRLNLGSLVRVSLFAGLMGTRQLIASVICPEGTTGEVISCSGHLADGWHVTAAATLTQAQAKIGLMALECCGPPKVFARAELLSLGLITDAHLPAAFGSGPFVPVGDDFGGADAFPLSGTTSALFPPGARLTHWIAVGAAPGAQLAFTDPSGFVRTISLVPGERYEGFPNGRWPVASVAVSNVTFSFFEYVD